MIFKKLRLHPFCGIQDREFSFAPGLNVVCGENDIGKSTMFKAIEAALFIPVSLKLNTRDGKEFRDRCYPIGSDHAAITLEFEHQGRPYRLEKTWSDQPSCRLTRPDGSSVTTPAAVDAELAQLYPTTSATFRTVLLARQGQLVDTLGELAQKTEVIQSLGELLRAALSQVGGVSVDRLKGTLTQRIADHFSKWDRALNQPEKARGIENPWKTEVGVLLEAYYARERLRKECQKVEELERRFGEVSAQLGNLRRRQSELQQFVTKNAELFEAEAKRGQLEARLAQLQREFTEADQDYKTWLRAEAYLDANKTTVETMTKEIDELTRELTLSIEQMKNAGLAERLEKARKKHAEWTQAKAALAALLKVEVADIQELRKAHQRRAALQASLEARKLKVSIAAKVAVGLMVGAGLAPEQKLALNAGEMQELSAAGRIRIETEHLKLEVSAGDNDFEAASREFQEIDRWMREKLAALTCASVDEAQNRRENYARQEQALVTLQAELKMLLGNETLEALEERARAAGAGGQTARPSAQIQTEIAERRHKLSLVQNAFNKAEAAIDAIKRRHKSERSDELMDILSARKMDTNQVTSEIAKLPPLPPEVTSGQEFRTKYRASQAELPGLAEKISQLSAEKAAFQFPEASAQDLLREKREAEARFDAAMKTGKSLLRVEEVLHSVDTHAGNLYTGLQETFEKMLAGVTTGKYGQAVLDGALPTQFKRKDGVPIPFVLLSAGMKDGVALSFRLAMARYFLANKGGALLIDDPMVNMDRQRQAKVAELLREFGADTQVLVFTCHETHAEAVGGTRMGF